MSTAVERTRKMYTVEFTREAVSLITDHGYGVSECRPQFGPARQLSVAEVAPRQPERKKAINALSGLGRGPEPMPAHPSERPTRCKFLRTIRRKAERY